MSAVEGLRYIRRLVGRLTAEACIVFRGFLLLGDCPVTASTKSLNASAYLLIYMVVAVPS